METEFIISSLTLFLCAVLVIFQQKISFLKVNVWTMWTQLNVTVSIFPAWRYAGQTFMLHSNKQPNFLVVKRRPQATDDHLIFYIWIAAPGSYFPL